MNSLTRFHENPDRRNVLVIFLLALVLRLIILPWSQTVHADAVSRVFIAVNWLANPHYITDGYWGPLHHYLNALFIWIFPGWVIGPQILNILLASLTALPLYGFTKNVFGSRTGAVYVSLIYVLSPIIMRNSFQALAEVPYGFFVASSMYFLSEGLKQNGKLLFAILAGLSITLAAATRYEAWVIIAAFTLVGMLFREWKFTAVFWLFAMFFPASWMVGNHLEYGDFLYSVNQNDVWNIQKEGINDNVSSVLLMQRKIFFPLSFLQNVSPITTLLLLFALGWAIVKRKMSRGQLIWLVPFLIMAAIFIQKAYAGTLMMQHRFTVTWLVLFLPFAAMVFVHEGHERAKGILMTVAVVTLIPLSFSWSLPKYAEWFGTGNLAEAMEALAISSAREVEAVPLLRNPETELLVTEINSRAMPDDGLILDFIGWDQTYYAALSTPVRSYLTDGAKHGEVDHELLSRYIDGNPHGFIVLGRLGRLNQNTLVYDSIIGWESIDRWLRVDQILETPGAKLFAYHEVSVANADSLRTKATQRQLFGQEKDEEFFKLLIRSDLSWFYKVRRSSFWDWEPLDTTITKNARYMVEEQKKQ